MGVDHAVVAALLARRYPVATSAFRHPVATDLSASSSPRPRYCAGITAGTRPGQQFNFLGVTLTEIGSEFQSMLGQVPAVIPEHFALRRGDDGGEGLPHPPFLRGEIAGCAGLHLPEMIIAGPGYVDRIRKAVEKF